jgi:glucan phosphorylase
MLNIRTRIQTDLNLAKWIWSRIRSENIYTVFTPIPVVLDVWTYTRMHEVLNIDRLRNKMHRLKLICDTNFLNLISP